MSNSAAFDDMFLGSTGNSNTLGEGRLGPITVAVDTAPLRRLLDQKCPKCGSNLVFHELKLIARAVDAEDLHQEIAANDVHFVGMYSVCCYSDGCDFVYDDAVVDNNYVEFSRNNGMAFEPPYAIAWM